jgi:UDP-2,4-diacetamido-2,4,6-trideoxy-beta-L-altropyranose hydrolase
LNKVLFRADSSSEIGLGHIMRDLVLAKRFCENGDEVFFACKDLNGNMNSRIPFPVEVISEDNEIFEVIQKLKIDTVVFDHYGIDWKFEKEIREKKGVKVWSFDDTYEKHYSDVIYNHNISAKKEKYKNLVPEFCEIKAGSKYTLIRDEFHIVKKKFKAQSKKDKTIFLAMGGADTRNLSFQILRLIPKNIKVNVVTTSSNKNLKRLKKHSFKNRNINLHVNSNRMAELMKESDFAIVSPSVIVHEVLFMDLPFIAIKTENNQNDIFNYLKKSRYKVLKEFNKNILKMEIREFARRF